MPRMMSPALATPGRNGTPLAIAALPSGSVRPGETMNFDPAAMASSSMRSLSTVPAPTMAPGTAAIARIASSACGVRKVTSSTGSPASTSVSASAAASIIPSSTSTGITGAVCMMASIFMNGPPRRPPPRHKGRAAGG